MSTPNNVELATALEHVESGDTAALKSMLDASPDLAKATFEDGATLLIRMIDWPGFRTNAAATARLLLEAGADVDARRDENNGTPLAGVLCCEDADVARVLLEFGANINAPLGWMPGDVLSFADRLCEGMDNMGRPSVQAFAKMFSDAAGRQVPQRAKVGRMIPLVFAEKPSEAVKYWVDKLGFHLDWSYEGEDDEYHGLSRGSTDLHLTTCKCPDGRHLGTLYARMAVEDVDLIAAEYKQAGVQFNEEVADRPWGFRECEVEDPYGNRLTIHGPLKDESNDDSDGND